MFKRLLTLLCLTATFNSFCMEIINNDIEELGLLIDEAIFYLEAESEIKIINEMQEKIIDLIRKNPKLLAEYTCNNERRNNLLHLAIACDFEKIAAYLMEKSPELLYRKNKDYKSALDFLGETEDVKCFNAFVALNDINKRVIRQNIAYKLSDNIELYIQSSSDAYSFNQEEKILYLYNLIKVIREDRKSGGQIFNKFMFHPRIQAFILCGRNNEKIVIPDQELRIKKIKNQLHILDRTLEKKSSEPFEATSSLDEILTLELPNKNFPNIQRKLNNDPQLVSNDVNIISKQPSDVSYTDQSISNSDLYDLDVMDDESEAYCDDEIDELFSIGISERKNLLMKNDCLLLSGLIFYGRYEDASKLIELLPESELILQDEFSKNALDYAILKLEKLLEKRAIKKDQDSPKITTKISLVKSIIKNLSYKGLNKHDCLKVALKAFKEQGYVYILNETEFFKSCCVMDDQNQMENLPLNDEDSSTSQMKLAETVGHLSDFSSINPKIEPASPQAQLLIADHQLKVNISSTKRSSNHKCKINNHKQKKAKFNILSTQNIKSLSAVCLMSLVAYLVWKSSSSKKVFSQQKIKLS